MTAPIDRIENIEASVEDIERQMDARRESGLDFPQSLTWRLLSECRSLLREVQSKPTCCAHARCPGGSLCCCLDEVPEPIAGISDGPSVDCPQYGVQQLRQLAQEALDQAFRFCHATKREPGQPPVARVIADLSTAVRALLDAPSEAQVDAAVSAWSAAYHRYASPHDAIRAALRALFGEAGASS